MGNHSINLTDEYEMALEYLMESWPVVPNSEPLSKEAGLERIVQGALEESVRAIEAIEQQLEEISSRLPASIREAKVQGLTPEQKKRVRYLHGRKE